MKKTILAILMLVTFCLVVGGSETVQAGHGHGRGHGGSHFRSGIYFGIGPFWGLPWYPYPNRYYYAPPAVVVTPPAAPVYVEPSQRREPAPEAYWYYCISPQGYYPYVQDCPQGWMKVVPQTPEPRR